MSFWFKVNFNTNASCLNVHTCFPQLRIWGTVFIKARKCQISELHSTENRASYRASPISDTSGVRMEGRGSKHPKEIQIWHFSTDLQQRVSVSLLHIITAVPRVKCTRVYFCLETKEICFLCSCVARPSRWLSVSHLAPPSTAGQTELTGLPQTMMYDSSMWLHSWVTAEHLTPLTFL